MSSKIVRQIKIFKTGSRFLIPYSKIRRIVERILLQEHAEKKFLNIIFVKEREILNLNKKFRSKKKVTDVLSFGFADEEILGEVYVCYPQAKRQAFDWGVTFEQEILRLIIHGVLQLLGYSHYRKKERKKMQEREHYYLVNVTV